MIKIQITFSKIGLPTCTQRIKLRNSVNLTLARLNCNANLRSMTAMAMVPLIKENSNKLCVLK